LWSTTTLVRGEVGRYEQVDVVLDQELAGVALGVLEVDVQPQLVREADVLCVDGLSAVLQRLGQVQSHGEAVRFVEEVVCVVDVVRDEVCRVLRQIGFLHCNLDVSLVAYPPASVLCEQLSRLDQLHLDGRDLDALPQRY
jgi:hypothetical protein